MLRLSTRICNSSSNVFKTSSRVFRPIYRAQTIRQYTTPSSKQPVFNKTFSTPAATFGASQIIPLTAFSIATTPLLVKKPVMCEAVYANDMSQPKIITTSKQKSILNKGELTFGTFLGFCTGFLIKKVGKIFAMFIGTGFVFLQYLAQEGYVTIHWDRLEGRYNKTLDVDKDGRVTAKDLRSKWQKFVDFLTNNIQFKSTFLIGLYAGIRYG
ncbi:hypothetical protein G6F70_000395 [Rhizopus microsporus]|nr:hypothetical protein G6F71_000413 [Rhizopus microsporus]KAG1204541.1 hypothetical protein G6F70_000395 [Rhizopus microsporus]KAG1216043.1 hypothetical protein G6F69_000470 [Rhizopus microsporus]KAG1238614.1 hypothetical protein G6F67_000307 [Rhizopus microsporus]KAG1269565.1 hypothetical protein G6F68_000189 [Rhizopus microsporus]